MDLFFLTQETGFLKPFSWVMGKILNAIYEFFGLFVSESETGFTVVNIALCIFVFTFVIKMLMLPLTIKQQKYSRLSSRMSPELQAIQAKYKGKRDEVSLRRQQEETQEVYAKYGTSPMGGCLPLLISLPIMFALYRVIYRVPGYVTEIGNMYRSIADSVTALGSADSVVKNVTEFLANNALAPIPAELSNFAVFDTEKTNYLIDVFAKFNKTNWDAFLSTPFFSSVKNTAEPVIANIMSANSLFGLNILDTPQWNGISVIIPILAAGFQFVQGKLQTAGTTPPNGDNPMANSGRVMNTVMPIMSGVFCLMLPIGVGVYWIATSVFTIIQTLFINKYLDKADLDEMIEKNLEKSKKKKKKYGVNTGSKMASVAKTSTKSYDYSYDSNAYKKNQKSKGSGDVYRRSDVSYSASSIAANANLLARNNKPKPSKPVNDAQVKPEAPADPVDQTPAGSEKDGE